MSVYPFDPYTESINIDDCPGVLVDEATNLHRCMGIGTTAINNRTSEFACKYTNCPLIGGAALQSAVEGSIE